MILELASVGVPPSESTDLPGTTRTKLLARLPKFRLRERARRFDDFRYLAALFHADVEAVDESELRLERGLDDRSPNERADESDGSG